jgi:hypothetical protein
VQVGRMLDVLLLKALIAPASSAVDVEAKIVLHGRLLTRNYEYVYDVVATSRCLDVGAAPHRQVDDAGLPSLSDERRTEIRSSS